MVSASSRGACGSSSTASSARSRSSTKRASISAPRLLGLVDQLDAGGQERVAADELEDAEALLALADQVMVAVGA